ncbi:MAG: signal peptidase II [Thermomicrobiales bacterium]|nr:signal peptidase II [Thermomicrobiales bacterium]
MPAPRDLGIAGTVAVAVFLLDQLTKVWIALNLAPLSPPRIDLSGTWLSLEYAENRGVAFGLLGSLGPFVVVAPLVVVTVLAALYLRSSAPPVWQSVGVGLLAGGAAGNLADRLRLGFVVDFISVGRWPNFNVADSAITVGAVTLIAGWMLVDGARTDD